MKPCYFIWVILVTVSFCVEVITETEIRYEGSSVWTIFLPSLSPIQKALLMVWDREPNTGVFFMKTIDDDADVIHDRKLSFFENPEKFVRIRLVAPPYLERALLGMLRANNITFEEFHDWRTENRIAETPRKYVVSSGTLPLYINIRNFKYEMPSEATLAQLYEPVDLIDKITVPNNSPATVIISLSESQTLTQQWEVSFTETLTGLIGGNLDINLPNVGGGGLSASAQLEFSSTQSISQSIERTYGIARQVAIPPFTTIQAHGYVKWLNDIQIPFEVIGQVYLNTTNGTEIQKTGLVYCKDRTSTAECYRTCALTRCPTTCVTNNTCDCCYFVVTQENAGTPNVMRDYLISQGMRAEVVGNSGKYLLLRLRGTFTASLGTDLIFNVTQILDDPATPQKQKVIPFSLS